MLGKDLLFFRPRRFDNLFRRIRGMPFRQPGRHGSGLGADAPGLNDGPNTHIANDTTYGSVIVTGHGKGIKCVAETIEHEKHHIAIYEAYHDKIAASPTIDAAFRLCAESASEREPSRPAADAMTQGARACGPSRTARAAIAALRPRVYVRLTGEAQNRPSKDPVCRSISAPRRLGSRCRTGTECRLPEPSR